MSDELNQLQSEVLGMDVKEALPIVQAQYPD